MREILVGVVIGATALGGCSGSGRSSSAVPARQAEATRVCTMKADGKDALRLTVPSDATCTVHGGGMRLESRGRDVVDVWPVPHATSAAAASGYVARVIVSEFKDFKSTEIHDMTVAGAPALRMKGDGVEADDNDPGHADVIVFCVSGRTFVACTHGESMTDSARKWLVEVVQTAKAP